MIRRIAAFIDLLIGGGCEKLNHVAACGMCNSHIVIPLTRNYYRWYVLGEGMDVGDGGVREMSIPNPVLHRLWAWATDNYEYVAPK